MRLIEVGGAMINLDKLAYTQATEGRVVHVFFTGIVDPLYLPWEDGGQALLSVLRKIEAQRRAGPERSQWRRR